jgi:hypothetical protein
MTARPSARIGVAALAAALILAIAGTAPTLAQDEIFSGDGRQRAGPASPGPSGDERFSSDDRCDWAGYERVNRRTGVKGEFVYSDRWIAAEWWHKRQASPSLWCDGKLVVWIDPAHKADFDRAKRCDVAPGEPNPCEEEYAAGNEGFETLNGANGEEIFAASEPPPQPPRGWQPTPKDPRVFSSCDPYYGGRKAFIHDLLYRTGCQLREGEEFWCRHAKPNMGNLSLSPRPDMPFVPTGVRMKKGECETEGVGGPPNVAPPTGPGAPPSRMVGLPDAPKPPPRTTVKGQTERICDLQTLAAWINRGYNTTLAVARMRVVNAKNPNTYVLLLSGMQPQLGKSTNLADAYIAWLNVQALSSYRAAIMDAVSNLPRGSTLILAGHSQGGMEAQNAVENLTHRWGFKVDQVISFGAPTSARKTTGVSYLNVRDRQDPIPMMDRVYDLSTVKLIDAGGGKILDPWVAHGIYARPQSGLINAGVPMSPALKEPCLEVDMTSLERYDTPTYFTRAFSAPQNPVIANNPTPRNPDIGLVNCFWVSLAQDRYLAEGLPYFAQCERGAPSWAEIERTLANEYGHKMLDDHMGVSPAAAISRHQIGRFGETTESDLYRALGRMGPGARGIVVVEGPDKKVSHAFNVSVNEKNVPEFFDAQLSVDGRKYFYPSARVLFYRTN